MGKNPAKIACIVSFCVYFNENKAKSEAVTEISALYSPYNRHFRNISFAQCDFIPI